jgi:methyltransferase (TIGR00027 family)
VKGTKPSRTAQGVTAHRAVLTDIGVLDDPYARAMLTPTMAAMARVAGRLPRRIYARSLTNASFSARVLWFDARVADALDAGIRQVAVVGAGYDTRAWRFARDGVRFLELDHPATQRDKVRRAPPGPGPTYVEADLTTASAAGALSRGGLDSSAPTLFVVEGVAMYLDEKVARRLLVELATTGAPGSRLAVNFSPPRDGATARQRRQFLVQRLSRTGSGETIRLGVDRAGAVELVETSGWNVDEVTSARDAARALVPGDAGFPVDEVSDKTMLVAGSC